MQVKFDDDEQQFEITGERPCYVQSNTVNTICIGLAILCEG